MIGIILNNQYKINKQIGRSRFIDNYEAQDQQTDQIVDLLILRKQAASDKNIRAEFQQKIKLMTAIKHPNLAQCYQNGMFDDQPFLVYEHLTGTRLNELISMNRAGMQFAVVIRIMRDVLNGLQAIHQNGLVHAAIQSSNIMIQQGRNAKISGYHLLGNFDDEQVTTRRLIIPPEFIRSQAPEPVSDIYSCGVVLYEMFTGGGKPYLGDKAPISGDTIQRIRWEQFNQQPLKLSEINPLISPAIDQIVRKCLQTERIKRYQSTSELLIDLENAYKVDDPSRANADPQLMETYYDGALPGEDSNLENATIVDESDFQAQELQQDSPYKTMEFSMPGDETIVDNSEFVSSSNQKETTEQSGSSRAYENDATIVDDSEPLPSSSQDIFSGYYEDEGPAQKEKKNGAWKLPVIIGVFVLLVACCVVVPAAAYFAFGDSIELPKLGAVQASDTATPQALTSTNTSLPPTATKTPLPSNTRTQTPTSLPTSTPTITSTPTPEWVIGDSMVRDEDGMEMMYVPAGEFTMGGNEDMPDYAENHTPEHAVYLDAFWMDKYEVSNSQYQQCIDAGVCTGEVLYTTDFYQNHPVGSITWDEASEYCEWIGGRLPTEAEWEKAARGIEGNYYPWGNDEPDCDKAQYKACGGTSSETGDNYAGQSVYGIENMSGNVWEWVFDWYAGKYYQSSPESNPTGPEEGNKKVLRGGSWNNNPGTFLLAYYRGWNAPDNTYRDYGFRCVVPLNP